MRTNFLSMKNLYVFLLSLFGKNKEKERMSMVESTDYTITKSSVRESELMYEVEDFLASRYTFRYNEMTEQTEYKWKKDVNGKYQLITQRDLNTFCMEARKEGINCWDRDISRYVHSRSIVSYNPFTSYMDNLPVWDKTDRVTHLAKRVSHDSVWIEGFHKWMLGMASQWMRFTSKHANSVAPVLVSSRQGRNKSTFCRMLMPDILQAYYTDSFELTSTSGAEQKLSTFGLINLDELDKYSERKMASLKNLMQMAGVSIRKAHKTCYSTLPRIASFIGTSNRKDLLTDPTGSRRFLCVDVENKIDCSSIDHAQVYAQLKEELLTGKRSWFNQDEETTLMEHNEPFQKRSLAEDLFYSCYRLPENEEKGQFLSAIQIYNELKKQSPSSTRLLSQAAFGKTLVALGVERKHTKYGNLYHVISSIA